MTASGDVHTLEGRRIADRYRLDCVIGSGGAGTVWSAVDEVLGRQVAVKEITAPQSFAAEGRETLRERTLREAQAAAKIGQHPNVVTVYDVVEEQGRPWIVMQLVQARSLADIIEEDGPCPPQRVAQLGLQLLNGLRAAHAQGILHRDVKPSNVLVSEDGQAVLTDFGIARISGEAALTASGVLMGAPSYIPPERAQGQPATAASDLWALGATLYCAVEGHPPYQREGALATIAAAVTDQPDPTSRAGPLAPLLVRMLDADPQARPDADEIQAALGPIAAPELAARPPEEDTAATVGVLPLLSQPEPAAVADADGGDPPARRRRWAPVVAATAALALLGVVLVGFLGRSSVQPGTPGVQSPGVVGEQTSSASEPAVLEVPATQAVQPPAASSAATAETAVQPSSEAPAAPSPPAPATSEGQPPVEVTQTSAPETSSTTVEPSTPTTTTETTQETTPAASSPAATAAP